jgi:hypothetical protein
MLAPPSSTLTVPKDNPNRPNLSVANDESLTEDYGEASSDRRNVSGEVDFFSSLGTEVTRKPKQPPRPDPDKPQVSRMELNPDIVQGRPVDHDAPPPPPKPNTPGGPGSQWRMMKLRRVYETAEEEGRAVEEIAIDRFGSLELFEEAKEERRILDEREGRRSERGRDKAPSTHPRNEKRMMFTDVGGSGMSSRGSSFRRPGGSGENSTSGPSTPIPAPPPVNRRLDSLRLPSQASSPLAQQAHTPIPSVMTPTYMATGSKRALSPSSLNKLQAKVLRAKLMNAPNAETLEKEYEEELRRSQGFESNDHHRGGKSSVRTKVEVLPTLNAQGQLYDVGHGKDDGKSLPGNRKKKEKVLTLFLISVVYSHSRQSLPRWKLGIRKLEKSFATMRMMIPRRWARCCVRNALVPGQQIRRTLTLNLQRLL